MLLSIIGIDLKGPPPPPPTHTHTHTRKIFLRWYYVYEMPAAVVNRVASPLSYSTVKLHPLHDAQFLQVLVVWGYFIDCLKDGGWKSP